MRRSTYAQVLLALAFLALIGNDRRALADEELRYGGKPLSEWVKGLDSEDSAVRVATRAALRRVDPKELPALMDALKDEDEDIRRASIKVLGGVGPASK